MRGVAIVDPAGLAGNQEPPNIYIESLIHGREESFPDADIEVPAGIYHLEIPYTSIDFSSPKTITYHYRLNGLFDEWKEAGNRRTAYFTALTPGKYTFEVKAEQFGAWSEVASLPFEVKPFFYQTTWFLAATVLLLVALGFFGNTLHSKHRQTLKLKATIEQRNRELAQSDEINKELDSFSYSISHDLRSPLRSINGYASILLEDYNDVLNDDGKNALLAIRNSSTRMRQLVDDLLSFSKAAKTEVRKSIVDMNMLAREVVREVENNESELAEMILHPLAPASGDTSLLRQVVSNLVANAVKYSRKKE